MEVHIDMLKYEEPHIRGMVYTTLGLNKYE